MALTSRSKCLNSPRRMTWPSGRMFRRPTTPFSVTTSAWAAQGGQSMSSCGAQSALQRAQGQKAGKQSTQGNTVGVGSTHGDLAAASVPAPPTQRCTRLLAAFAASKSLRSRPKTSTTASVGASGVVARSRLPVYGSTFGARTYSTPWGSAASAGWPAAAASASRTTGMIAWRSMRAGALVRAYAHADKIDGQPRRVSGCTGFWAALLCLWLHRRRCVDTRRATSAWLKSACVLRT
mmetsp:Transcript_23169/g.60281  ORF Transcript_23169/g.60281 Transcript_23169/m.60281 type:complete len:236 (-) Transcript_23169:62-769(-)